MYNEGINTFLDDVESGEIAWDRQIAVLVTSPPCRPFSNATREASKDKATNTADFETIIRAVTIFKPAYEACLCFITNVYPTIILTKYIFVP